MVGLRQSRAFHTGIDEDGRQMSPAEREKMMKPYLPPAPPKQSSRQLRSNQHTRFHHKQRVRPAIRHLIHSLIYNIIHTLFSIYIRIRQVYHAIVDSVLAVLHYHHRTPELIKKDVKNLVKKPKHLSVLLTLPPEGGKKDRLETLVHDVCEIAAWSASAGIPLLSVYERTGILKSSLPHLHRRISGTMTDYFGATSSNKPTISLRAPHLPSYSPPHSPEPNIENSADDQSDPRPHLNILFIDEGDGRQTLVDLTKTLAEMAQRGKIAPADISSELIDAEITESVMGEPDLLVVFGERVVLDGYPPWQARLSEIFHVQDNSGGVGYHVFLRALYKYGEAQFRIGR